MIRTGAPLANTPMAPRKPEAIPICALCEITACWVSPPAVGEEMSGEGVVLVKRALFEPPRGEEGPPEAAPADGDLQLILSVAGSADGECQHRRKRYPQQLCTPH